MQGPRHLGHGPLSSQVYRHGGGPEAEQSELELALKYGMQAPAAVTSYVGNESVCHSWLEPSAAVTGRQEVWERHLLWQPGQSTSFTQTCH